MNIRKMEKDDLELLSFTDMAYNLIKMDKVAKTTVVLFKEICSLMGMSNDEYAGLIGDFFTSLTTDKRFILLNSINWDLKENHSVVIVVDDSDDDEEIDDLSDDDDEEIKKEEDLDLDEDGIDDIGDEETIDDSDDEVESLEGLEIVDEDIELEE